MQSTTPLSPQTLLRHEAFVLRLERSLAHDVAQQAEHPHFADQPGRVEAQVELMRHAAALGLGDRAASAVAHTYQVRSIFPTWHDHLVAFQVAQRDGVGDVLAGRVLRTWAVDRRR